MAYKKRSINCVGQAVIEYVVLFVLLVVITIIGGSSFLQSAKDQAADFAKRSYDSMGQEGIDPDLLDEEEKEDVEEDKGLTYEDVWGDMGFGDEDTEPLPV